MCCAVLGLTGARTHTPLGLRRGPQGAQGAQAGGGGPRAASPWAPYWQARAPFWRGGGGAADAPLADASAAMLSAPVRGSSADLCVLAAAAAAADAGSGSESI